MRNDHCDKSRNRSRVGNNAIEHVYTVSSSKTCSFKLRTGMSKLFRMRESIYYYIVAFISMPTTTDMICFVIVSLFQYLLAKQDTIVVCCSLHCSLPHTVMCLRGKVSKQASKQELCHGCDVMRNTGCRSLLLAAYIQSSTKDNRARRTTRKKFQQTCMIPASQPCNTCSLPLPMYMAIFRIARYTLFCFCTTSSCRLPDQPKQPSKQHGLQSKTNKLEVLSFFSLHKTQTQTRGLLRPKQTGGQGSSISKTFVCYAP